MSHVSKQTHGGEGCECARLRVENLAAPDRGRLPTQRQRRQRRIDRLHCASPVGQPPRIHKDRHAHGLDRLPVDCARTLRQRRTLPRGTAGKRGVPLTIVFFCVGVFCWRERNGLNSRTGDASAHKAHFASSFHIKNDVCSK